MERGKKGVIPDMDKKEINSDFFISSFTKKIPVGWIGDVKLKNSSQHYNRLIQ